MFHEPRKA